MATDPMLFEVSWEVANKVGGIHTVLSTKAKTLRRRFGDDYVAIGPWLLSESDAAETFREEEGFDAFVAACAADGVPVRVGRWLIPGEPRTVLVAFSEMYAKKDGVLAGLWERHQVDSLHGGWDYVEPVMFAHAAALVITRWWRMHRGGLERRAVAHFHEWMTGAGLLRLRESAPEIASVFTTHATVLGRAASSERLALTSAAPAELAEKLGVRAKHSLEVASARGADAFTTVSSLTADEAELVLGRRPEPITPNGMDLDVIDTLRDGVTPAEAGRALRNLAARFLGAAVDDAALVVTSGRYEFRNKGMDVLLDAMGILNREPGRPIVLFVLVPAGNSGMNGELLQRLRPDASSPVGPVGIVTHNLLEPETDPVLCRCRELGIANNVSDRVKVIFVPLYLARGDGLLDLPYEAVLQAMDLSCFPSIYEPWGYTPQESLAVGVPTVTADTAGFGRWSQSQGLTPEDGVYVLSRANADDAAVAANLAAVIDRHVGTAHDGDLRSSCRRTAQRTAWSHFVRNLEEAYDQALARSSDRSKTMESSLSRVVNLPHNHDADRRQPHLVPFTVSADLPLSLRGLEVLSRNLWWTSDASTMRLFAGLDPQLWEEVQHNPVELLKRVPADVLRSRADDASFLEHMQQCRDRFEAYVAAPFVPLTQDGRVLIGADRPVAYFCAEFGLHESLPIYSGGLGVLAGDHLKAASDLGLPMVAVGLFYCQGYFRQQLTATGEQIEEYPSVDARQLPLELVRTEDGRPLEVRLGMPGGSVTIRAWRALVGRVPLVLMDTDVPGNREQDLAITRSLYGGESEMRLRQEIVLGKGGVRFLRALGIRPSVYHLNEGHAALAGLERISQLQRDEGLTFDAARRLVRATTVFTTHTPVAAGHDRFGPDLMRSYFADAESWIGVPWDRFFSLGQHPDEPNTFNMTGLALNLARSVNGVSKLHRDVSRGLLAGFWPGRLACEAPIEAITNGVHLPTWTREDVVHALATDRPHATADTFIDGAPAADDADLWRVRCAARRELLDCARTHVHRRFVARHDSPRLLTELREGLEADEALVIGFARRFAPYKRAHLLFRDIDRLADLLSNVDRPVRLLIAGKAHPNDGLGQDLLASVVKQSRDPRLAGRAVFLEDHNMALGRLMVQGADLWLNTPTHLLEASGTSGMKAAANGSLNLSVLDGWWAEGAASDNGWTIGGERVFDDQDLQDELDAENLYNLLESEIVPMFFDRDEQGLPRSWLQRVRRSFATIPPAFNAGRMVSDYVRLAYLPRALEGSKIEIDGFDVIRDAGSRAQPLRRRFQDVSFVSVQVSDLSLLQPGDNVSARADVRLGDLSAHDIVVELVFARSDATGFRDLVSVSLEPVLGAEDGAQRFEGSLRFTGAGRFAYGVRARVEATPGDVDPEDPVIWA